MKNHYVYSIMVNENPLIS